MDQEVLSMLKTDNDDPPYNETVYGIDFKREYDEEQDFMVDATTSTRHIFAESTAEALLKLIDEAPTGITDVYFIGKYEPGDTSPTPVEANEVAGELFR